MSKRCSGQIYVQGFDFQSVTFKQAINMFERIDIAENIYDSVVET